MKLSILALAMAMASVMGKEIPSNLQKFYDSVKNAGPCTGQNLLKGGFYDQDTSSNEWAYCQRNTTMGHAMYIKGPGDKLSNMDIDCDGDQTKADPRCKGSRDIQPATTWKEEVKRFNITDLNASIHPYVVLGNVGALEFDPRKYGIHPLSVVAVVCGGQLLYGVWGDINGNDRNPLVGEASLALATACFGEKMTADNGHDASDVLYLAFSGAHAVPHRAKWAAKSYEEFERSISSLGDALVAGVRV